MLVPRACFWSELFCSNFFGVGCLKQDLAEKGFESDDIKAGVKSIELRTCGL